MRTSKRDTILEAAVGIIEESGIEAVTYEALSDACGLSKSGLVYHFPSRQELLLGIHRHLADEWEREMETAAGGTAAEVDAATRLRAIVMTLSHSATRAELLVQLDAVTDPASAGIWDEVDARWMPSTEDLDGSGADAELARAAYLVQVAADGLWVHDYVHRSLTASQRKALTASLLAMIPTGA